MYGLFLTFSQYDDDDDGYDDDDDDDDDDEDDDDDDPYPCYEAQRCYETSWMWVCRCLLDPP